MTVPTDPQWWLELMLAQAETIDLPEPDPPDKYDVQPGIALDDWEDEEDEADAREGLRALFHPIAEELADPASVAWREGLLALAKEKGLL